MYDLVFRWSCSQHHLEFILVCNVQHLHDFPVRHCFVSIQSYIHFRLFRCTRLQERSQLFKRQRLFLVISESSIIIQILIYDDSRQRLCGSLLFSLRQQYLDSVGRSMVDVIIKKISSRKIRSVMDAMLKLGDILTLRFNTPLFFNS